MAAEPPEFVTCSKAEERLLLLLIDRMEGLEKSTAALTFEVMGNPLETITPSTCPSVLQEGRNIARSLSITERFALYGDGFAKTIQIRHQCNIDLLERQGFTVEGCFASPLPTDYYTVSWGQQPLA